MRSPGDILLISTYSLGHAPLGIAWPAGFLRAQGFQPALLDLSRQELGEADLAGARLIVLHVPMHTAMRLALEILPRLRHGNPGALICCFGLYAHLHARLLLEEHGIDFVIGGEPEEALVDLATALAAGRSPPLRLAGVSEADRPTLPVLRRLTFAVPSREGLPPLGRYVKLAYQGRERLVGYVEASRGCKHTCLHCPITPIYAGRFFAVPLEVVVADIDAQVAAGAEHITFGDPDFLNGPAHALNAARALHQRHPRVTFDFTAKVSHLLAEPELLVELRDLGNLFVVSAFESLSDEVLARLDKGHTRADVLRVVGLARELGLSLRPSLIPFTPWTTLDDIAELFDFVEREDLVDQVDPMQLTIRLLVPRGSALLATDAACSIRDREHDPLTQRWRHRDPRLDQLQRDLSEVMEERSLAESDPRETFYLLRERAARDLPSLGAPPARADRAAWRPGERPPRLTEPWFC